jgi:hypothetical protein
MVPNFLYHHIAASRSCTARRTSPLAPATSPPKLINFSPFTTSFPKSPLSRLPPPPPPSRAPLSRRPRSTARDTGQRPGGRRLWWCVVCVLVGSGESSSVACAGRTCRGAVSSPRVPWGGTVAWSARRLRALRELLRGPRPSLWIPPTTGWWRRWGTVRTPSCTARSSCRPRMLWPSSAWISISSITTSWAPTHLLPHVIRWFFLGAVPAGATAVWSSERSVGRLQGILLLIWLLGNRGWILIRVAPC